MATSTSVGESNLTASQARSSGAGTVSFTLSPPLYGLLEDIAAKSHERPEDLIRKGLAFLKVAMQAREEGKLIGIAREGEPLETVIDVFS